MKRATSKILILFILVNIYGVKSQLISKGSCPNIAPLNPVQPALITRVWFEHLRTPSINEHGLRCVSASVTFNTAFGIRYTARSKVTNARVNLNGIAVFIAGTNVGALSLSFTNRRFPFVKKKAMTVTIVAMDGAINRGDNDNDNDNRPGNPRPGPNPNPVVTDPTWLTLYSCKQIKLGLKMETSYILTTLRAPSQATVAAALNSLTTRNLPTANLKEIDQTNC